MFNPVQHELRVYRSVDATYEFAGGESLPVAVLPDYHKAYFHTLANFSHLGVGTFAPQEDPVYWILLGENWPGGQLTRGIEPLRVWKTMRGFTVRLQHILGASPDDVRTFIRSRYLESVGRYPVYFLLVGSEEQVPLPACGWHYNGGGPIYSDHWYACVVGTDAIADVPLGRLPFDTEAAVKQAANKVVKYERDPPVDWQLGRVLLANHQDPACVGAGNGFADLLSRLGVPFHRQCGSDPSVTNYTLKTQIENGGGYGILNYYGHGEIPGTRWQWNTLNQDFTMSNVAGLTNTEWLPLVYNIACHCAQFDPPSNQCAVWLGGSTGGVAAWGFAREASALEAGQMNRALLHNPHRMRVVETGLVSMAARLQMLNQYPGSDRASANNRLFHLMGDPTLNVWARDSGQLTVQVSPSSMVVGSSARRVDVWVRRSNGTPLPGAAVGFYKEGEPHILDSAR